MECSLPSCAVVILSLFRFLTNLMCPNRIINFHTELFNCTCNFFDSNPLKSLLRKPQTFLLCSETDDAFHIVTLESSSQVVSQIALGLREISKLSDDPSCRRAWCQLRWQVSVLYETKQNCGTCFATCRWIRLPYPSVGC